MKLFNLSILVMSVMTMSFVSAQSPVVAQRLKSISLKFEKLPLETRENYVKFKRKATEASRDQKYFSCMVAIDDALQLFSDDMDLIWLRGICWAQIHDVDRAIKYYHDVLEINPSHIPSLMNLVEINFFGGRYEKAAEYISDINKLMKSRGGSDLPLLDFKYFISISKLEAEQPGEYEAEIKRMTGLYSYMEDHPYYYYSHALQEFSAGDKQEGLIWILKAYLILKVHSLLRRGIKL